MWAVFFIVLLSFKKQGLHFKFSGQKRPDANAVGLKILLSI